LDDSESSNTEVKEQRRKQEYKQSMKKHLGGMYSNVPEMERIFDQDDDEDEGEVVNLYNNDEVLHTVTEKKNGSIIYHKVQNDPPRLKERKMPASMARAEIEDED